MPRARKLKNKNLEFFELEAEESCSDYGKVKKSDVEEDDGSDLEDFIDKDEEFEKSKERLDKLSIYLKQQIDKDLEEIDMVINKKYKLRKYYDSDDESEKTENPISKKKKIVKSSQNPTQSQTSSDTFGKTLLLKKVELFLDSNLPNENENFGQKVYLESNEKIIKKKIQENSSGFKRKFNERLQENNKIIKENVINLNNINNKPNKMKTNSFIPRVNNNSFLNAMKNDKYGDKSFFNKKVDGEDKENENKNNNNLFSIFRNPLKTKLNSDKKNKISAIFGKIERTKIIKIE
jgi:hypothetical protein